MISGSKSGELWSSSIPIEYNSICRMLVVISEEQIDMVG